MFVVVMLLLMAYLLIRRRSSQAEYPDVQYEALWVFVASALATSVTLMICYWDEHITSRMLAFQMHVDKHHRAEQEIAAKMQTLILSSGSRPDHGISRNLCGNGSIEEVWLR